MSAVGTPVNRALRVVAVIALSLHVGLGVQLVFGRQGDEDQTDLDGAQVGEIDFQIVRETLRAQPDNSHIVTVSVGRFLTPEEVRRVVCDVFQTDMTFDDGNNWIQVEHNAGERLASYEWRGGAARSWTLAVSHDGEGRRLSPPLLLRFDHTADCEPTAGELPRVGVSNSDVEP